MAIDRFVLARPRASDLPALSALCLRSKGYWDYDAAFLDACRNELTLHPDQIASTVLGMATRGGVPSGLVQISLGADPADLLKLFVDPPLIGHGLGRRLFDRAVAQARAQGAAAFYAAMSARPVGTAASGSIPGRRLPLLVMDL